MPPPEGGMLSPLVLCKVPLLGARGKGMAKLLLV